jgi:hypothetical protein
VNNFVTFWPKKSFLKVAIAVEPAEPWADRLKAVGLDSEIRKGKLHVSLTAKDFEENKDLIREILREAVSQDEKEQRLTSRRLAQTCFSGPASSRTARAERARRECGPEGRYKIDAANPTRKCRVP